ncbi:hypothetical protein NQ318_017613 [Aromia moschata]|uniref:Uncharacterized protein n=1 Tax=Aromia moschata TaxID=1265417 RepID=A0AAV8Z1I7_9CUCU|nr:hypothetical protein NQ318_017613 [Aromia moschata]
MLQLDGQIKKKRTLQRISECFWRTTGVHSIWRRLETGEMESGSLNLQTDWLGINRTQILLKCYVQDMHPTSEKSVRVWHFRWHKAFAEGREDVNDENCVGRPSTSSSDDNVKRVRDLLNTDRRLSVRLISETLDITKTIVHEIVSESLGMRKVCAKLVPKGRINWCLCSCCRIEVPSMSQLPILRLC